MGATMVSAEGACAAYYSYGRHLVSPMETLPPRNDKDRRKEFCSLLSRFRSRERKTIVMGHGSGGKLTAQLVNDLFLPAFNNEYLNKLDDQAVFQAGSARAWPLPRILLS